MRRTINANLRRRKIKQEKTNRSGRAIYIRVTPRNMTTDEQRLTRMTDESHKTFVNIVHHLLTEILLDENSA